MAAARARRVTSSPVATRPGLSTRAYQRASSGCVFWLIRANRQDQKVTRYPAYRDLAAYCELSANPVGELVLHIFASATPRNIRFSGVDWGASSP